MTRGFDARASTARRSLDAPARVVALAVIAAAVPSGLTHAAEKKEAAPAEHQTRAAVDDEMPVAAASDDKDSSDDSAVERRAPPADLSTRLDPPPVELLCQAAVALALADPERARGFVNRARLAGWLPEIHFRVYRRFARTEGLTFSDIGPGVVAPVGVDSVDDVRYEWRASWDLSRMVFNPDELQAHLEALRMADVRRDIQTLVIKLYFERRRLVLEGDRTAGSSATQSAQMARAAARRCLRMAEIDAQLDAMSGGALSGGGELRGRAAARP